MIGEYANVWEAVRMCAGYSTNCVKWIGVNGAQPEEVVYSHPSFARNEQVVKVIREAEKCVVEKKTLLPFDPRPGCHICRKLTGKA